MCDDQDAKANPTDLLIHVYALHNHEEFSECLDQLNEIFLNYEKTHQILL